ncbi:hypothetical protein GCM10009122_19220 [Fulvivirga kasyanovii]|uniref:Thioredoxin domain-containing protein n=1 Tax=Fulvivirga kasyanovii TaxID=396812 RepID=A0ABW9RHW7_9BACT|nr:hypothetical protein [Fulvivirga kasyanovii]MTI23563.1 hypothetical protein [Fulvivirga kasyanovii]
MKLKLAILSLLSFALFYTVDAQVVGNNFPALEAETVEDAVVNLPEDTKGKYTLLGMAYSKKSEDDLNTWFSPVYNKFIRENAGLFSSFGYDVNVYFIPMFTGINAAATGTAKNKALKNIDPKLLPYILFYKGKLKPYKEALEFEKKDVPYFFVLDKSGKIIYATSGKYTEDKMSEIEALLE